MLRVICVTEANEMIEPEKKAVAFKGRKQRRTTLSLTPELWEWLKAIEKETGARPSVTVRRALQKVLGKTPKET
jgi:Ribbon-helix-helix domain